MSNIMQGSIVSSLRGRLRVEVPGLSQLFERKKEIAEKLSCIRGVRSVQVTPVTGSILFHYDAACLDVETLMFETDSRLSEYALDVHRAQMNRCDEDDGEETMTVSKLAGRLVINAAGAVIGRFLPITSARLPFLSVEALTALGLSAPLAKSALKGLETDLRPNADFLTVTSIIASILLGSGRSALLILALSDIAELMTSYTIERTRSSIKDMLSVDEKMVWKSEDGHVVRVNLDEVGTGDIVVVHTGEKIAVDGAVISGQGIVDESAITGEFIPAEKHEGSEVFAGSVVKSGVISIQTAKVGDQTVVSRIIGMVESSALKRAPIQRYADRFSNYLVPLNFLLFAVVYGVTKDPRRALKMLVIDYSCGIKLSTATAFSAAINAGVRQGMLIKGGAYLEQMSGANTVLFDKTGTVTEGRPEIVRLDVAEGLSREDVLSLAMSAEETSAHPIARAVLDYGRRHGVEPVAHGEVVTEVSRGTRTTIDGKTVRVGSMRYMSENGAVWQKPYEQAEQGIANYVALDSEIIGVLYAMDKPKENVRRAINALRYEGVGDIELLTGDSDRQAQLIAELVGTDSYSAQLLPEDKAETVLKLQNHGNSVVMVGDGINDAPALAFADVGISLGSRSTDIAIETSDVVISRDDPMTIPALRRMSRETMRIVHQNFAMVVAINTVGLILGASSNISVLASAVLHNSSTILVVANSLRLLFMNGEKAAGSDNGYRQGSKALVQNAKRGGRGRA
ncbi:MAG: cadmium-translocating P-type ATPase [Clostridia bacterium]|nr:cadmium-translocating P-type ATPase [Clostridia bacterium]